MAKIANPRKSFNFTITIVGIPFDAFLAQKVSIPEIEAEVVEHGDTNHDIKTAGRVKYGMINIEKIITTSGPDNYFYDWLDSCQSAVLGGGLTPTLYKRDIVISEFAEDGATVINTYTCFGCWPSKIAAQDQSRTESDNTVENIDLCVDVIVKV